MVPEGLWSFLKITSSLAEEFPYDELLKNISRTCGASKGNKLIP